MRLSFPVFGLKHTTSSLTTSLSWLSTLKTKQLQHIAQKTGLPTSGTKPVLVAGLECGLAPYRAHLPLQKEKTGGNGKHGKGQREKRRKTRELSILSIDMGIRNLAFVHLRCDPFSSSISPHQGAGLADVDRGKNDDKIVLNAWRRISLPFSRPYTVKEFEAYLNTPLGVSESQPESDSESESLSHSKTPTAQKIKKEKEKESFSLPIYAAHAHSIISTLLSRYNPTHILIERQRFRSGGGSAVQEWSLRVGVFEGMLWAVLETLRAQSQARLGIQGVLGRDGPEPTWPAVISIEPGRVGRYWMPQGASTGLNTAATDASGKPKKRTTSREGKKLKIDLVGSWLENGSLAVGVDAVEPWVETYMSKWKEKKPVKTRSVAKSKSKKGDPTDEDADDSEKGGVVDIGKLDDLADCLVQGITWLEWEGMRERVARDETGAAGLELP
jgi:cruciform cutting endonuclease 1